MFVWVKDVRSVLGMQESSFRVLLTDAGSDATAMAGCVETVSKGIVIVGGEREDAGLFWALLAAGCLGRSWLWSGTCTEGDMLAHSPPDEVLGG